MKNLDDCLTWLVTNLYPEDVFPKNELKHWATKNGYVLADD